eukprot:5482135-Pyramimonas_sp.AAC.1
MGVTGPSPRGRPSVAWADRFVARLARESKSVTRRNKMCSNHPLSAVKPVASQTETTGDEGPAIMTFDFTAVC